MDEATLKHLNDWARSGHQPAGIAPERLVEIICRFIESLDEDERQYWYSQTWNRVFDAADENVGLT